MTENPQEPEKVIAFSDTPESGIPPAMDEIFSEGHESAPPPVPDIPEEVVNLISENYNKVQEHTSGIVNAMLETAAGVGVPGIVGPGGSRSYSLALEALEPAVNYWIHQFFTRDVPAAWAAIKREEARDAEESN